MSADAADAYGGFTAPAVLANKKQMGEALAARVETHRSVASWARDAWLSLTHKMRQVANTLGLGSLVTTVSEAVTGASSWLIETGRSAWRYIGGLLGWGNVAAYVATDRQTRNTAFELAGTVAHVAKAPFRALGWMVSWVPFVGTPLVNAWNGAYAAVEDWFLGGCDAGADWMDRHEDSLVVGGIRGWVEWKMVGRVIRRFLPSGPWTWVAWGVYIVAQAGDASARALTRMASDPAWQKVSETVKGSASSTAAKLQDIVVDRVADGPGTVHRMQGTQPGTEAMEVTILTGDRAGQKVMLEVDVDSRGHKRVHWEGADYDVTDLGTADNDPIRPTGEPRIVPLVRKGIDDIAPRRAGRQTGGKAMASVDEVAARLKDAEPQPDGLSKVAAAVGVAPQVTGPRPAPPTRRVRRAQQAAAKAEREKAGAASSSS